MAKPGLVIALGVGKKPPKDDGPPPFRSGKNPEPDPKDDTEPDPTDPNEGAEGEQGPGTGIGPADVDYSDGDSCSDCVHMQGSDCSKYNFSVQSDGHCAGGFAPKAAADGMVAEGDTGPGPMTGGGDDWENNAS